MTRPETYMVSVAGMPMPHKELFDRIAKGDEAAFKILFENYRGKFYSAVLHFTKSAVTAEELTQETFINIWRSRAGLTEVDNPNAYLYRIVFNLVYTYLSKESNEIRIRKLARYYRGDADYSTIESLEANETAKLIAAVVDRLPRQQKTVYQLSRERGLTYQEIADELNISPNTVRNHLVEALKSVRSSLKGHAFSISILVLDSMLT